MNAILHRATPPPPSHSSGMGELRRLLFTVNPGDTVELPAGDYHSIGSRVNYHGKKTGTRWQIRKGDCRVFIHRLA